MKWVSTSLEVTWFARAAAQQVALEVDVQDGLILIKLPANVATATDVMTIRFLDASLSAHLAQTPDREYEVRFSWTAQVGRRPAERTFERMVFIEGALRNEGPVLAIWKPDSMSPSQHALLYNHVKAADTVDPNTLARRLEKAHWIAALWFQSSCVGSAVLKLPAASYRAKVFNKAGVADRLIDFEIGYVHVRDGYKGQGLAARMLQELSYLLPPGTEVFSTTGNPKMANILQRFGFVAEGNSYPGEDGTPITLFTSRAFGC